MPYPTLSNALLILVMFSTNEIKDYMFIIYEKMDFNSLCMTLYKKSNTFFDCKMFDYSYKKPFLKIN